MKKIFIHVFIETNSPPSSSLSPTTLVQLSLPPQGSYNTGSKKHTSFTCITYPLIYTLNNTPEQGSTNCGTQGKPGCQFCKQSLVVFKIYLFILIGG